MTALDPGDIDRLAVESRRRQGLPDYVEDPATIARVVRLILAGRPHQVRHTTSMQGNALLAC